LPSSVEAEEILHLEGQIQEKDAALQQLRKEQDAQESKLRQLKAKMRRLKAASSVNSPIDSGLARDKLAELSVKKPGNLVLPRNVIERYAESGLVKQLTAKGQADDECMWVNEQEGLFYLNRNSRFFPWVLSYLLAEEAEQKLWDPPVGVARSALRNEFKTFQLPMPSSLGYLYFVGGQADLTLNSAGSWIEACDPDSGAVRQITPSLPNPRALHACALLGNDIVAAGGNNGTRAVETVSAFSFRTRDWTTLPSMSCARSGLCLLAHGEDKLYAIGGWTGHCVVSSVESYDSAAKKWMTVGHLSTPRYRFGAASVGSKIFVFGGISDNKVTLDSVEMFDPIRNISKFRAAIPTKRKLFGTAVLGDHVYLIGGQQGAGEVAAVERYDTMRDCWTTCAPLPRPRTSCVAVAIGAKILVLGEPSFWYDAAKDTWSPGPGIRSKVYCSVVLACGM